MLEVKEKLMTWRIMGGRRTAKKRLRDEKPLSSSGGVIRLVMSR